MGSVKNPKPVRQKLLSDRDSTRSLPATPPLFVHTEPSSAGIKPLQAVCHSCKTVFNQMDDVKMCCEDLDPPSIMKSEKEKFFAPNDIT